MRSVRLDPDLDARVQRAAAAHGESVSEFIRRAVAARADETLGSRTSEQFADVAGIIHGGGRMARRTGVAFSESIAKNRVRH